MLNVVEAPRRRVSTATLLAAARTDGTERWQGGVTWEPELCSTGNTVLDVRCGPYQTEPDGEGGGVSLKPGQPAETVGEAAPILVWAGTQCGPYADIEELTARLRRFLDVDMHRQLETEFWAGSTAQNTAAGTPYLASTGATVLNGGDPTGLLDALAGMQDSLPGVGVIHATKRVVTRWQALGVVGKDGNAIVDLYGNRVVPGAGYTGSSPTGDPAGAVEWVYGTGPIEARIGEPLVLTDFDRRINQTTVRVEREIVVWFDPCTLTGVPVDLETGSGS